jgi:protein translocase SecG subunit
LPQGQNQRKIPNAKIRTMGVIVFALQIISGLLTIFFVLLKEPKSEGLGAIGSSANSFKGVRTSADEKLDNMTWIFAGTFILCSALLGLKII